MRVFRGAVWRDGGFFDGWLAVDDDGRVTSSGSGAPPAPPDASGVITPSPVNAHTHVADRVARDRVRPGMTLEEAVAPPDGLKHRVLRETPDDALVAAMRASLDEAHAAGARVLLDFREGGAHGATLLARAGTRAPARAVAFARPASGREYDAGEVDEVLDASDGIGLSAIRDVPWGTAVALAAHARRRGKRFALHFSEGVREDVARALDLAPDFVVHAVRATRDDVARLADARVPVVVCPRSNARLVGALPDVRGMLDAGIEVCVGTDNAMFQSLSVWDELRFMRERFTDVTPAELVRMAVDAPRESLRTRLPLGGVGVGDAADFVVLAGSPDDPWSAVFGREPRVVARVEPAPLQE